MLESLTLHSQADTDFTFHANEGRTASLVEDEVEELEGLHRSVEADVKQSTRLVI